MQDYISVAESMGFTAAALLPVCELVVVPEYRKFCEQNLCGKYGVLPACPPMCGSVEEMSETMRGYETALVLMMETTPVDLSDEAEQVAAKKHQNLLTERLVERLRADGIENMLMMGAGPWKKSSCMSAYCVDAQKMADAIHMKCWADDGKVRYFSLILF